MKKRIFFLLMTALVLSGITAYGYWTDRVDIKAQVSVVYKPDILIGDGMGGSSGSANIGSQAPAVAPNTASDPAAQAEGSEESSNPADEAEQTSENADAEAVAEEVSVEAPATQDEDQE